MRKVSLRMLTPDMELGKSICRGSSVLINAGTKGLTRFVPRLQRLGVSHIYIQDGVSDDIEIDDLIGERTRLECKQTLEKSFRQLQTQSTVDIRQVTFVVENIIDEVLHHSNMLVSLNEIGDIGDNTLDHSINTTIYALCLGMRLRYSTDRLRQLAYGTLLHDVGKTTLENDILFKTTPLTQDEFEHIKQHAQRGYELLGKNSMVSEVAKRVALCHHERMDGSGYPNGLHGSELSEFTRITSIVDVYEALTVNRCYHRAITPQRAMEILTEEATTKLDMSLATVFLQNVAVYPNGTSVLLSDGRYAVVKHQNQSLPLRPVVRTLSMRQGKCVAGEEIDLLAALNLTIVDSDINLPGT